MNKSWTEKTFIYSLSLFLKPASLTSFFSTFFFGLRLHSQRARREGLIKKSKSKRDDDDDDGEGLVRLSVYRM